jgi:hypothetical protein
MDIVLSEPANVSVLKTVVPWTIVTDTVSTDRDPGSVVVCTIVDSGNVVIIPDTVTVLAGLVMVVTIVAPGIVVRTVCLSVVTTAGRVVV